MLAKSCVLTAVPLIVAVKTSPPPPTVAIVTCASLVGVAPPNSVPKMFNVSDTE